MLSFIILLCPRSSVRQAYANSSTGILLLHYQLFLVVRALGLAMHTHMGHRADGSTQAQLSHHFPTWIFSASQPSLWRPPTAQHFQFYLNHLGPNFTWVFSQRWFRKKKNQKPTGLSIGRKGLKSGKCLVVVTLLSKMCFSCTLVEVKCCEIVTWPWGGL